MQKHENAVIKRMHSNIAAALSELSEMFAEGYLLTFVARHPTSPEKSTMIGDDGDTEALIAHIRYLDAKEEVSL